MEFGFNTYLKISGVTGILSERGSIDEETSEAILRYSVARGDYERLAKTYETSISFGRSTRVQAQLVTQPGYFTKIEELFQERIFPSAQKSNWCDLIAAQMKTSKLIAKRKAKSKPL